MPLPLVALVRAGASQANRSFLVAAGLTLLPVTAAAAVIRISRAALAGDAPG